MRQPLHMDIRASLEGRIVGGEWALGDRIPDEIDLAREYGCARATINRALQALADDGIVVRKRKGGTRINPYPVRQAKFEIPIIREEVEASGRTFRHIIEDRELAVPPKEVQQTLAIPANTEALRLETLYLADQRPFAYELRWVNVLTVPDIVDAPLNQQSANEWLVETVPFSSGEVAFSAKSADEKVAKALGVDAGTALFTVRRTTWLGDEYVTTICLTYHEGYELKTCL